MKNSRWGKKNPVIVPVYLYNTTIMHIQCPDKHYSLAYACSSSLLKFTQQLFNFAEHI
jgi:hypothetical protein